MVYTYFCYFIQTKTMVQMMVEITVQAMMVQMNDRKFIMQDRILYRNRQNLDVH